MGFTQSKADSDSRIVTLLLQDFLTGDEVLISESKRELFAEFEMKDLRALHFFLGLEVWQESDEIFPWARKIHRGDTSEIWDDGLQVYVNSHGCKSEVTE